jgi:hypothetical protein
MESVHNKAKVLHDVQVTPLIGLGFGEGLHRGLQRVSWASATLVAPDVKPPPP